MTEVRQAREVDMVQEELRFVPQVKSDIIKPCFLSLHITIMQSRATGIADHILPLGDLFSLSPLLLFGQQPRRGR